MATNYYTGALISCSILRYHFRFQSLCVITVTFCNFLWQILVSWCFSLATQQSSLDTHLQQVVIRHLPISPVLCATFCQMILSPDVVYGSG